MKMQWNCILCEKTLQKDALSDILQKNTWRKQKCHKFFPIETTKYTPITVWTYTHTPVISVCTPMSG